MRKLTIKNLTTVVNFREIETVGNELKVTDKVLELPGKVKKKDVDKEMESRQFVNGSVSFETRTEKFTISENEIKQLLHGFFNGAFRGIEPDENGIEEPWAVIKLPKTLYMRTIINNMWIEEVEITDTKPEKDGWKEIKELNVPLAVYMHLWKENKVD